MNKLAILALAVSSAFFVSCSKDKDMDKKMNHQDMKMQSELKLNLTGLEELGNDFQYEGWLIVDGKPVSTGTFKSVKFPQTFMVDKMYLDKATKFVLTIEPMNDKDPKPSETKLLAGDFMGKKAMVSSNKMLGDLKGAMGKFILATPTTKDNSDEDAGVWFMNPATGMAGLELPKLPMGWKYEGWIVIDGKPISTGKFMTPDMKDENAMTSMYKGMDGDGPMFPGEDLVKGSYMDINFPHSLKGSMVVISVEPSPDNSPKPFSLKPLAKIVPSDAMDHSAIDMDMGPQVEIMGEVMR